MKQHNIDGFLMESWKCEDTSSAYRCFLDRAKRLVHRLVQASLPPEIERSILSGKSGHCKMGDVEMELICKDSSGESTSGMMLIVKRQ